MSRHVHRLVSPRGAAALAASFAASLAAAAALSACGGEPPPPPASATLALSLSPPGATPRLFAGAPGHAKLGAATAADAAVGYVARLAPQWGAPRGPAELRPIATVATGVGDVVRVAQSVDGVVVDGRELRVLVRADGSLGAASGTVIPADRPRRGRFDLGAADAVASALAATHAGGPGPADLVPEGRAAADDEAWFRGAAGARPYVKEARARKRWHDAGDHLEAAWVVEAYSADDASAPLRAFRTVVSATDGAPLAQLDLQADDVAYRVWAEAGGDRRPLDGPTADITPHPTGAPGAPRPPFTAPNLVSVSGLNHPAGGGPADPWLPAGATETLGNHVDAYVDGALPDGLSAGDYRASVTGPGVFGRLYDLLAGDITTRAQQEAAVTQVFYTLNWLHDDWYDAGFTEAAGNAQADNLGRGGIGGDPMMAETGDFGWRNNASMMTPGDGMSPRMQLYFYGGASDASVTVQTGGEVVPAIGANFDPAASDVTARLIEADDGTPPLGDACQMLTGNVSGAVVLVDRGMCLFEPKAMRAQAAGAVGVILVNNVDTPFPARLLTDDPATDAVIRIPVMMVTRAAGAALRARLGTGPVTVRVQHHRTDHDVALDNMVVAHEYGHYIHQRLTDCFTAQCRAMSEGWGDFIALHLAARAGDDLDGTFAYGGFEEVGDPYFGSRRVPYSVDFDRNALTFGHMADGVALPSRHPVQALPFPNSEVHNAGEVWASMLWEGYVALVRSRPSFAEARRAMAEYVVDGLLLAPPGATVTETRDALLMAAGLASPADRAVLAAAFARRGAGSCAASPLPESQTFAGIGESFELQGVIQAAAPTIAVDAVDCDGDLALDAGETATVRATIGNSGGAVLGPVTVALTSATPGLAIETAPIEVPPLAPLATTTVSFAVRSTGAGRARAGELTLTATAADACRPSVVVTAPIRLDVDDRAAASAIDAFDAEPSVWSVAGEDAAAVWTHARAGLDGEWTGADLPFVSETSLVSPPMTAGSGPVTLAVDLAHDLEAVQGPEGTGFYDGLVMEVSTDDGATWRDVGGMAMPRYNGTLYAESHNPLGGRPAYSGRSPGYPTPMHVKVALGTTLAGKTFRFRFLVATDNSAGAPGVRIDNVAVTGLVGLPFPVQGDDAGACSPPPEEVEEEGGCCQTGAPAGGNALAALAVLAQVGLRRRRRAA